MVIIYSADDRQSNPKQCCNTSGGWRSMLQDSQVHDGRCTEPATKRINTPCGCCTHLVVQLLLCGADVVGGALAKGVQHVRVLLHQAATWRRLFSEPFSENESVCLEARSPPGAMQLVTACVREPALSPAAGDLLACQSPPGLQPQGPPVLAQRTDESLSDCAFSNTCSSMY